MIIGPNEAGKSTTLAAFERFLFGFPKKDNYNILKRKNLWVGADLQLNSGEKLGLWRKNSQVNSILGENQIEERPQNLLDNYLNPIDSKTYMKLFGLNQDKLREGGRKLVSGEGEFADILFGESLGDLQLFNNIRKSLKKDADELFKLDGRARTPLNTLKSKIDELNKKLQDSATRTAVWAELESGRNSVKQELDRVEDEIAELKQELQFIRNRLASVNHVAELKQHQEELKPLADLPRADYSLRQQLTEAEKRISAVGGEINASKAKIKENEDHLAKIIIRQKFLDCSKKINHLANSVSAIEQHRRRLDEINPAIEKNKLNLRNRANELGFDMSQTEQIPRIDAATKKRFEKLAQNINELKESHHDANKDVIRLTRELESLGNENQQASFPENTVALIRSSIREIKKIQEKESILSDLRLKLKRTRSELIMKLNALPLWSGNPETFSQIQIPAKESIEIVEQELREADNSLKSAKEKHEELKLQTEGKEKSIATRRQQLRLPSLEELLNVRQERDQAWADIDARWKQGAESSIQDKSIRSDTFSRLIKQTDQMADQLRDHAELVTEMLQLEDLRATRDTAGQRLLLAEAKQASALQNWQSYWSFLDKQPENPAEVKAWLNIRPEFDRLSLEIANDENQLEEIQSAWPQFRNAIAPGLIADLVHDCPNAEMAITILTDKLVALESQKALQTSHEKNIRSKTDSLNERQSEKSDKFKLLQEAKEAWRALLQETNISENISPEYFPEYVADLNSFCKDLAKYEDDIQTGERLTGQLIAFDDQVHGTAEELEYPEDPGSTCLTIEKIKQEVDLERSKSQESERLKAEISQAGERIIKLTEDAANDRKTVENICQDIGVADASLAEERFTQIHRRNEIEKNIRLKCELLLPLQCGHELDQWITVVESDSPDKAQTAEAELQDQIKLKETRRDELFKELGAWNSRQNEIQKRVGEARSFDARNDQSLLIESTNQHIRNYLKNAITNKILEEATQDYRKRMGDDVLNRACLNFRTLSLGSFEGIRAVPNETGGNKLVAVREMNNPYSDELELNDLSEGTRDQLFLALKLAMIQNRLEERARNNQCPLPVIFDDILVQFDDERAKAAFKLFQELARKTQVIFLTHHDHLESVASEALGPGRFWVCRLGKAAPQPEYQLKTEPKRRRKGDKQADD